MRRAALDEGITTFDTADVYAGTRAEAVLGRALKGERREGLEIFTKVYWPTGRRTERPRPVPQAHHGVDQRLAAPAAAPTTSTSTRRTGSTTRRRSRRRWGRSPTSCAPGKALYIGVSEWTRRPDPPRATRSPRAGHRPARSPTSRSTTCCGGSSRPRSCPTCEELGIGQIVWSPIAQGVLTGKYLPGQPPPEGSRATDEKGGANVIQRLLNDDVLTRVQQLKPLAEESGLSLAQLAIAWVLQNPNVSAAIIGASRPEQVAENVKAAGVKLDSEMLKRVDEVLGPRRRERSGEGRSLDTATAARREPGRTGRAPLPLGHSGFPSPGYSSAGLRLIGP